MGLREEDSIIIEGGLDYLKDKIFALISFFWVILGGPLFFLGTYSFFSHGYIMYAVAEIIIYIITALVITSKKLTLRFKKIFTVLVLYLVSISVLLIAGALGVGMICVFFSLILSVCLLDNKQFEQVKIVNIIIFIAISILLEVGFFDGTYMEIYKKVWIINGIIAQACGYVLVFIIDKIFNGLEARNKVIKESKELLAESEYRYEAMLDNISDFIAIVNIDGIVKYISPNIEKRTKYKINDILDKPLWEKAHIEDREKILMIFLEILKEEGAEERIEARFLSKDGREQI